MPTRGPGVAGTRTTRFRPASCWTSNPCSSAQARTCSITGSSWREGRAIVVSVSKCCQNGARLDARQHGNLRCHPCPLGSQMPRICFFFASNSSSVIKPCPFSWASCS